jgi:hypothetical protein
MKDTIEIVLDDGSNRVALWRNTFVQLRRGVQTTQSIDLLMGSWRAFKLRIEGDLFALFVVEANAHMVGPDVRKRQREVIKEVLSHNRLHRVVVLEGEGILADLKRVAARGLADSRTKIFRDVLEAAESLARTPGAPSVAEMLSVVSAARDPTRQPLPDELPISRRFW